MHWQAWRHHQHYVCYVNVEITKLNLGSNAQRNNNDGAMISIRGRDERLLKPCEFDV